MRVLSSLILTTTIVITLSLLSGCSHLSNPNDRWEIIEKDSQTRHWSSSIININLFSLRILYPQNLQPKNETLTIFIEGDGFSWVNRYTPSNNPTPKNPVAYKIAAALNDPASVYLSRPCQNVFGDDFRHCNERYWTTDRFSPIIIDTMNTAIDHIKERFHAKKIKLVGYSGGGVIALLVAAQRSDVIHITTIASNIDTQAWTDFHHITPIETINPTSLTSLLQEIPQIHYAGKEDSTVPPEIIDSYINKYEPSHRPEFHIIDGFDHSFCWEKVELYWKHDYKK